MTTHLAAACDYAVLVGLWCNGSTAEVLPLPPSLRSAFGVRVSAAGSRRRFRSASRPQIASSSSPVRSIPILRERHLRAETRRAGETEPPPS